MRAAAQLVCLSAAFWVALAVHRRREPAGAGALRFLLGLALGGALAHLGWVALYVQRALEEPRWVLAPAGFSVLFVPLGLLAVAPWGRARGERERFLAAAFASLPLALATARLGCLVAGCCGGIATDLPWGLRLAGDTVARHPTALYDILGLVALDAIARRQRPDRAAPAVLAGIGMLRLAIEPLRAAPPLGPPLLPAAWIASFWVALGAVMVAVLPRPEARAAPAVGRIEGAREACSPRATAGRRPAVGAERASWQGYSVTS